MLSRHEGIPLIAGKGPNGLLRPSKKVVHCSDSFSHTVNDTQCAKLL